MSYSLSCLCLSCSKWLLCDFFRPNYQSPDVRSTRGHLPDAYGADEHQAPPQGRTDWPLAARQEARCADDSLSGDPSQSGRGGWYIYSLYYWLNRYFVICHRIILRWRIGPFPLRMELRPQAKRKMGRVMQLASFSMAEVTYATGDISYLVQEQAKTASFRVKASQENVSGVVLPTFEVDRVGASGTSGQR